MIKNIALALGFLAAAAPAVAALETTEVSGAREKIMAVCGIAPAFVVGWEDFGKDPDAMAGFREGGLGFLSGAFVALCMDPALKSEVVKQISKVVLTQAHGAGDPVIYLTEGALHVEYLWARGQPAPDMAFVRDEIASRLKGEEPEAP